MPTLDQLTPFEQFSILVALASAIIAVLALIVNLLYTSITLMLWITTKKTVELNSRTLENLVLQTQHQINLSYSSAEHKIVESHRELYLSLIEHPELLKTFADNIGKSSSVVERNILGSLLINHAASIYFYHRNGVISTIHLEGFIKDARGLFLIPFMKERWNEVRDCHTFEFASFVDDVLFAERSWTQAELVSLVKDPKKEATTEARCTADWDRTI
jgi:hypothetical protein